MHTSSRLRISAAAALVVLLATGCGGSDDEVSTPYQVPASATASPMAYSAYTASASLSANDQAEPLELGNFEPPTSETDEPDEVTI
jgi:hypothetical protein